MSGALRIGAFSVLVGVGLVFGISSGLKRLTREPSQAAPESKNAITKAALAKVIGPPVTFYKFPTELEIPQDVADAFDLKQRQAVVQYSFDPALQQQMEALIRSYGPDYGAFVAINAETGRVLSMISFSRLDNSAQNPGNLALKATFPSASVFKVVTAAAAIENKKLSADSVVSFAGSNHTLYKKNVLYTPNNRWTRHMTLREAFAKSVNTVFGKIGAFTVGPEGLKDFASRFGFNRKISADVDVEQGHAPIPSDPFELAETASGYTRDNTMSPMQGALIAAAIANDGAMMEPYVVDSVHSTDGNPLYVAQPKLAAMTVDEPTASEIRALMRQTVRAGTSRHAFRGFFKKDLANLNVGGKTGSLTGETPPGKYDWFVGFGDNGHEKIAVAALTIHQKLWRVKSSYLARRAFEMYFKGKTDSAGVKSGSGRKVAAVSR